MVFSKAQIEMLQHNSFGLSLWPLLPQNLAHWMYSLSGPVHNHHTIVLHAMKHLRRAVLGQHKSVQTMKRALYAVGGLPPGFSLQHQWCCGWNTPLSTTKSLENTFDPGPRADTCLPHAFTSSNIGIAPLYSKGGLPSFNGNRAVFGSSGRGNRAWLCLILVWRHWIEAARSQGWGNVAPGGGEVVRAPFSRPPGGGGGGGGGGDYNWS